MKNIKEIINMIKKSKFMSKSFKTIISGAVLFSLISCQSRQNNARPADVISIDIVNPNLSEVNDMIAEYEIIPLETMDTCLINDIHQLHVMNQKIYVTDGKMGIVYIFDENGKYMNAIRNQGNGPHDYIRITNVDVDAFNNRLIVGDAFSRRFFLYDVLGNLQQTIQLSFPPRQIVSEKSGVFLNLYGGSDLVYDDPNQEQYHIHVIDSTGHLINTVLKDQTLQRLDIGTSLTTNYLPTGEILYLPMLSDTIYQINSPTDIRPVYAFNNLSSYKLLSREDKENMSYIYGRKNDVEEKEKEGYLLSWGGFLSTDNFMFFQFGWNKWLRLYYSKENKRSVTFLVDEIDKGDNEVLKIFLRKSPSTVYQDWFYISINSMQAGLWASKLPEGDLKAAMQKMQPEDNPLIIRYRIQI